MIRILFVCTGNICRSPMAEFVMKDLVEQSGRGEEFHIESAAVTTEEIGNPVYPPARQKLASVGISCEGKRARQLRKGDYAKFDYIIGMDNYNLTGMHRILGKDPEGKIHLLLDFTEQPGEIDDPWYTRDFDTAYDQIKRGCEAFLRRI